MFGFIWPLWLSWALCCSFKGIGFLFEAVRFSPRPKTASVHGSARPAEEREAQAAARWHKNHYSMMAKDEIEPHTPRSKSERWPAAVAAT
jgi:hypothetical protein